MCLCGQGYSGHIICILITSRWRKLHQQNRREELLRFFFPQVASFPLPLPAPGSVTFSYTSCVYPKRCVGVFALNPKNHVPHPAPLLTAPAAYQSWGVHLQEPNEVLPWGQERAAYKCKDTAESFLWSLAFAALPGLCAVRRGITPCTALSSTGYAGALGRGHPLPPASGGNTQTLSYCCDTNRERRFANHPSA